MILNKVPEFYCYSCLDSGLIEVCHQSTDALLYWANCESCRPRGRYMKFPGSWGRISREVWIPSPKDIAKPKLTEVPF